jgi:hypothetical protein
MASFLRSCHLPDCGLPGNYCCTRCVTVAYCSPGHQRADWKAHKPNCGRFAIIPKIQEVYKNTLTLSGQEHIDTLYGLYNTLKVIYRAIFINYQDDRSTIRNNTFNIDSELTRIEREIESMAVLYVKSNNILDDLRNSKRSGLCLFIYYRLFTSIIFLSSRVYKFSTPPVNMTIFDTDTTNMIDVHIYTSIINYGFINNPIDTNTSSSDRLDIIKRAHEYIKDLTGLTNVSALLQTKIAELKRVVNLDGGRRKTRRRR